MQSSVVPNPSSIDSNLKLWIYELHELLANTKSLFLVFFKNDNIYLVLTQIISQKYFIKKINKNFQMSSNRSNVNMVLLKFLTQFIQLK